ncbi:putative multimer resolution protein [Streptomyces himastatinicus ATCC 53653]|uniref:Putative multimer resolution protein n=1 Tax=Streptomyces himastatinicus ATCC 53653 TaxID=457427 RepID=D9WJ67_9ACTN|nr:putative multimer resolution protein [Streptomyces himastatinicus ATCC 53653]
MPRLIARRTRGPLFLTDRNAPAGTPTRDVCPQTGRARLSYRRAEEIFEENTRLLANPLASPDDIEDLDGWTLHRLRHSALTHDAEDGTSTPMLLARSRHASVRSLERYARPGVDSVARHVAERDPFGAHLGHTPTWCRLVRAGRGRPSGRHSPPSTPDPRGTARYGGRPR